MPRPLQFLIAVAALALIGTAGYFVWNEASGNRAATDRAAADAAAIRRMCQGIAADLREGRETRDMTTKDRAAVYLNCRNDGFM